ncbi:MAG: 50S ribosomal protein L14 [Candidatus Portnoybacteria bacterium]|nr:50S ribosomal protein L14 [Candidatus Portnoybacteria bacterium]
MIQKGTNLNVADNTGAKRIRVIQVLGGTGRRFARIGDVVTVSVKEAEPGREIKKKAVLKVVIVRTKVPQLREDGSYIRFDSNDAVIVDGFNPKGNRIFGPVPRELKKKGFGSIVSLAKYVV